jgi:hypothetical protein
MIGIKDKIVEEMKIHSVITFKTAERRYSLDDYLLIDRVFTKRH